MRGLSIVAASGGHSSSLCAGLSLSRPLLLQSIGSRRAGSVVVAHGPSCSAACGILPDQGPNPCPLHWQADSQPLHHQGSPTFSLFNGTANWVVKWLSKIRACWFIQSINEHQFRTRPCMGLREMQSCLQGTPGILVFWGQITRWQNTILHPYYQHSLLSKHWSSLEMVHFIVGFESSLSVSCLSVHLSLACSLIDWLIDWLNYSWFTMLCYFLVCSRVIQFYIYINIYIYIYKYITLYIYIYLYICLFFFIFFSIMVYCKILNILLCAIQ